MDPRVIAERKAVAMARIESGLDELTRKFDFDQRVAGDIRKSYTDPDLTDLRRVEGIADLIEGLIVVAEDKVPRTTPGVLKPSEPVKLKGKARS